MKLHGQMIMMGYSQILDSYVASSRESGVFENLVNRDPRIHIIDDRSKEKFRWHLSHRMQWE